MWTRAPSFYRFMVCGWHFLLPLDASLLSHHVQAGDPWWSLTFLFFIATFSIAVADFWAGVIRYGF